MSRAKLSFNDVYKEWRNRARKYRLDSVVTTAMRFLHEPTPSRFDDIQRAPWQVMLLVKWVCQDRATNLRTGVTITPEQFNDLRERLWKFPDDLDLGIRDSLPARLFVRQLIRAQIDFQRKMSIGFLREAAILAKQSENHPLRRLFAEKARIDVVDFMDLAWATYAAILAEGTQKIGLVWFDGLRSKYSGPVVDAFVASVSRTLPELVAFCRSLPDARRKVASEYFEFPVLSRYPFLRTGDIIECWHPFVFYRGMESFVHSVLSEQGQDYIDRFSKLFEQHVVLEAKKLKTPFIDEETLRRYVSSETRVPDGLLSFPSCNIFVEAKAGLFDESVMTVGHNKIFSHKTKALRTAVSQAWATSASLRKEQRAPRELWNAKRDYLLIVTNRELSASRGTALAEMYPPGTLDSPSPESIRFLPLEHIYVLSIDDFERLMSGASTSNIELPSFLDRCVEIDQNPDTSVHFFEQRLDRERVPRQFSELLNGAGNGVEARLRQALGG